MKRILRRSASSKRQTLRRALRRRLFETLEPRQLLASDFGDAPAPYPTTLAEGGAQHLFVELGPRLGSSVDTEADGVHSLAGFANADDNTGGIDDEDGVTFGSPIRVGQLDAVVTVNVSAAASILKNSVLFDSRGLWFQRIAFELWFK